MAMTLVNGRFIGGPDVIACYKAIVTIDRRWLHARRAKIVSSLDNLQTFAGKIQETTAAFGIVIATRWHRLQGDRGLASSAFWISIYGGEREAR
jgi:hypothetical protein